MKKTLGYFLIALPFIVVLSLLWVVAGIIPVLIITGAMTFVVISVYAGLSLIE